MLCNGTAINRHRGSFLLDPLSLSLESLAHQPVRIHMTERKLMIPRARLPRVEMGSPRRDLKPETCPAGLRAGWTRPRRPRCRQSYQTRRRLARRAVPGLPDRTKLQPIYSEYWLFHGPGDLRWRTAGQPASLLDPLPEEIKKNIRIVARNGVFWPTSKFGVGLGFHRTLDLGTLGSRQWKTSPAFRERFQVK